MVNRLAILICTLPERYAKLRRLLDILEPQIKKYEDRVFYRLNDKGVSLPTGTKRNHLIEESSSEYFCFCDDDDVVMPTYLSDIMEAVDKNPDVVTFDGWITEYGGNARDWFINLGSAYEDRNGCHYRFPNHLSVMKRILVEHIKFPPVHEREDFLWAEQIHNLGLLKTEIHIHKKLYWYDCWPKNQPKQSVYYRRGIR